MAQIFQNPQDDYRMMARVRYLATEHLSRNLLLPKCFSRGGLTYGRSPIRPSHLTFSSVIPCRTLPKSTVVSMLPVSLDVSYFAPNLKLYYFSSREESR